MDKGRDWAVMSGTATGLALAAIGVFVVTVSIGVLNGLDLVEFDHNTLMTHVHAGTLGWITLAVFAICGWMFEATPGPEPGASSESAPWRVLAWLAIVSIPLYVLAFWTGNIALRATLSLPVLVAIVGLFVWLLGASRQVGMTTPRLGVLAAMATLAMGGFFGTLIQFQLALGREFLPIAKASGGHVTAMAFGYLVLVGMAIVEWRLGRQADRLSRAGVLQVGALFVGSLLLTVGAVANIQALLALNTLFQVLAVAIFIARTARPIASVPWLASGGARYIAMSGLFVVIDIGLLVYLIVQFVTGAYGSGEDISVLAIPPWLIFALDHAIFIGVMSNAIFGLFFAATHGPRSFWDWADRVVFVGMNAGLAGFVLGLAMESATLKQVFSPLMGASIFLGLFVCAVRIVTGWRLGAGDRDGRASAAGA